MSLVIAIAHASIAMGAMILVGCTAQSFQQMLLLDPRDTSTAGRKFVPGSARHQV